MDRARSVDRRLAVPERPGSRLLLAGGEERDEVEGVPQPAHDLLERGGAAVAKRRRLLVRELRELRLEREVDPARAVLDRDQRLRRQRLELSRQLPGKIGERRARVGVGKDLAQLLDLRPQLRIARLRLLLDSLETPLDVVAIRDEQLELPVLHVTAAAGGEKLELEVLQDRGRLAPRREAVEDDEQGVHLPQRPEQRRAGSRDV